MFIMQKYIATFLLVFMPYTVLATEVNYSVSLIVSKYDNLNLQKNPVQGEISESLKASLIIAENTANLVANVNASIQAINYENNQSRNRSLNNLIANALWSFSPGRYEWYVSDAYTQTLTDSFGSNTPDNRQNTNAFSTGPNFIFRINSRNNLTFNVRLKDVSFESAQSGIDADNKRVTYMSNWLYKLQNSSTLSLNYITETVEYDDELVNSNFTRKDVFLKLNYQKGMNVYNASMGITRIDNINENIADLDAPRFKLSVLNTRTKTSTVLIELNRSLTDTSAQLLNLAQSTSTNTNTQTSVTDVFINKSAKITYGKTLRSGLFSVTAYKIIKDYQQQSQLNQVEEGLLLKTLWNTLSSSRFSITAKYTKSIFNNLSSLSLENNDYIYTLLYSYSARRFVTVSLGLTSQERESSDPTREYEDFKVFLSLTYSTQ